MVLSRSGELSLRTTAWLLTAKSLRPLPDKHRGISDPETRVRQRYLDLAVNPVGAAPVDHPVRGDPGGPQHPG